MASYARECGLRVALATNGTLVTTEVAHKIVDAGVRRVSISLDGADAATHDAFRGIPGAFDKALQGLRNLKDLGMSVQINMTIARHNAHQLPAVLEMARRLARTLSTRFCWFRWVAALTLRKNRWSPPTSTKEY